MMRTSIGITEIMKAAAMRCGVVLTTALAVALVPALLGDVHAASDAEWNNLKKLESASYFSEVCQHEAEALGIARTADGRFLVSAFARSLAAGTPDARVEWRLDAQSGGAGCGLPVVALINLLRLNGIGAELVLVSMHESGSASGVALSDRVDGVLVYVPTLDRYVDPAATDLRDDATLDRIIKGRAVRTHLIVPALAAGSALSACHDVCMRVYTRGDGPDTVRIKTEAIRVP